MIGRSTAGSASHGIRAETISGTAFLWLALGFALSPALVELLRHWANEPWARGSATFVPLFAAAALADRSWRRPRRGGWLLVASALLLVLAIFAGGFARVGRLGIPLAVLGMARALGHPSLAIAAITCFVIPIPFGLTTIFSPGLESAAAHVAHAVAQVCGADWAVSGSTVATAGGSLALAGPDMGLPLAQLLAGLGFCAAVAARDSLSRGLLRMVRWALWAVPAQGLALFGGVVCLALAGADLARAFLDVVPTCAVAAIGVVRLRAGDRR